MPPYIAVKTLVRQAILDVYIIIVIPTSDSMQLDQLNCLNILKLLPGK